MDYALTRPSGARSMFAVAVKRRSSTSSRGINVKAILHQLRLMCSTLALWVGVLSGIRFSLGESASRLQATLI